MSSLFVDRRGVQLELDADALIFRENGERIGTVPVAPLTRVFLRGDVRLSAALLGKLGERGVGVVVLSGRQGKPSLLLARPHNDATRRVEQVKKSFSGDERRLDRLLDEVSRLIDQAEDDLRAYLLPKRGLKARLGKACLPQGIQMGNLPVAW